MAPTTDKTEGVALLLAVVLGAILFMRVWWPRNSSNATTTASGDDATLEGPILTYTPYSPKATWWSDLQVLRAMWLSKITGDDLQERLNSFYQQQADLYDSYRVRMLHGRPLMLQAVAKHMTPAAAGVKEQGIVWVDLACGTGYNVESFRTCLDKFHAIYLLDLCVPLTQVAQRDRADKYNKRSNNNNTNNNTHNTIHVIHGDATDFDCPGLPVAGSVDLVTISYSLVMIPNWHQAIQNALRLLKPDGKGMIAISDFTVSPDQRPWMQSFWKRTFQQDHVYLDDQHLRTLFEEFDVIDAAVAYGPLPYTPSFLQPAYYHFCGRTKTEKRP
jgi:ubiquinone/menaquinone biosynthesis C-methylase UbiE